MKSEDLLEIPEPDLAGLRRLVYALAGIPLLPDVPAYAEARREIAAELAAASGTPTITLVTAAPAATTEPAGNPTTGTGGPGS